MTITHRRSRIREAVAELLAGIAAVSTNRTAPLQPSELPCISVYGTDEAVAEVSLARRQERSLQVVIDAYVGQPPGGDLDDAMDAMALRVEQAIAGAHKLGGLVSRIALTGTTLDALANGDLRAGVARLTYRATYQTTQDAPGA